MNKSTELMFYLAVSVYSIYREVASPFSFFCSLSTIRYNTVLTFNEINTVNIKLIVHPPANTPTVNTRPTIQGAGVEASVYVVVLGTPTAHMKV